MRAQGRLWAAGGPAASDALAAALWVLVLDPHPHLSRRRRLRCGSCGVGGGLVRRFLGRRFLGLLRCLGVELRLLAAAQDRTGQARRLRMAAVLPYGRMEAAASSCARWWLKGSARAQAGPARTPAAPRAPRPRASVSYRPPPSRASASPVPIGRPVRAEDETS
eukprot:SAG31_NODE_4002_length_3675_cov_2.433445_2_plen_164_part_00